MSKVQLRKVRRYKETILGTNGGLTIGTEKITRKYIEEHFE